MKDFFKLSRSKVIGAVGIALLNIGLAIYSAQAVLCTYGCPEPNTLQSLFAFTIQPFVVVVLSSEFVEAMRFLPESVMIVFSLLISAAVLMLFWYLLACVVYWATSSLKKSFGTP